MTCGPRSELEPEVREFIEWVRLEWRAQAVSLHEMARRTGLTRQGVRRVVRGITAPGALERGQLTLDTAVRLAKGLGWMARVMLDGPAPRAGGGKK